MNVIIQFDTKYLLLCHLNDQSNKQNECHHTIWHQISVTLSFKWSIKQTKWMSSYNLTPNICYSVIQMINQTNKKCHHTIFTPNICYSVIQMINLTKWMSSYNLTPNICYSVIQMINQTNKMNVIIQFDTKYLLLCHSNDQSN